MHPGPEDARIFFYIFTQTRPTPIDYLPYFKHVTGTRHIILFGLNNNTTNALADPGGAPGARAPNGRGPVFFYATNAIFSQFSFARFARDT